MSKSISLTIQMNMPCDENWSGMEPTEQGRFCNKCQKNVVNFVDLTNQQILNYFLEHPFPVCGRMLNSQRDYNFENSKSKINRNLSPVAATLLTLATITAEASHPPHLPVNMLQEQLPGNKQAPDVAADAVSITGTVKNEHGNPIENAEIIFNQHTILSDKNGNFHFTLLTEFNKPGIIQFSYGNLIREVRSYHPVMGSTSFDVILYERHRPEPVTMGIAQPAIHLPDSLSKFSFQSSNKLDIKTKSLLADLAIFMKDNPFQKIILRSYYNTTKQKADKLSRLIKNFLELEEGIAPERVQLANPQLRKQNTSEVIIEFKHQEE